MEFRILGPIGVDVDEYQEVAAMDPKESPPELHIAAWPSHVLTSLVKRVDVAVYEVLRDYSGGTFTSGFRRSASPRASSTSPSAAEPSTSSARRSRTSELISSQVLSSSLRNLPRREPAAPA
jgi:basic membrane lipoprotein Med (substrate-binding protein (PBP1-ABC) superfamily)